MQRADRRAVELLEIRALLSATGHHADADYFIPAARHLTGQGDFLSSPAQGQPLDVALDFLIDRASELGLTADDVSQHVVTDQYVSEHTGVTHIYLQQTHNDLPILNATININVSAAGEVINVGSRFLNTPTAKGDDATPLPQTVLPPINALRSFAADFGLPDLAAADPVWEASESGDALQVSQLLSAPQFAMAEIPAELQYVPTADGDLELVWRMNVQTSDGGHWYDASVGAEDGNVKYVTDWVSHATYNVYPSTSESPDDSNRSLETDPFDVTASPYGWHDTNGVAGAEFTTTQGNNVHAYLDRDGNDAPDALVADGGSGLSFDFPLNLTDEPDQYQQAAVTNLFYWTNLLHDIHYQYGFDEASGNFQEINYSGQGQGGDALLAEAQDGADVGNRNNANMTTPPDGSSPRMQMYVWNTATPARDGSLDAGIIVHEYGHGVSHRLTGGPSNSGALDAVQSAGLGEGWSDWYALMFTQDESDLAADARGVGTYASNKSSDSSGIRTLPYSYDFSVNGHTFSEIAGASSRHRIGETWAATLWDLNWALIHGNSLDAALPRPGMGFDSDLYHGTGGNNLALQLVMDGMKLQPANPSFLDARDAILAADRALTGGVNQLTIWTVFARRGMGYGADDGGDSNKTNVVEAFDLPAVGMGVVTLDSDFYEPNDLIVVTVRDSDLNGTGTVVVTLSTDNDTESLTLSESPTVHGIFSGSIGTSEGAVTSQDGVLQIAGGDVITVEYSDADHGDGSPAVVQDSAAVLGLTDIFVADFSDDLGNPSAEGFVVSGPANEWHLSTGRGHNAGHSADDSFYFGSGEGSAGGGSYGSGADGTLLSPEIDLSQATSAQLSFQHFLKAETFFDFPIINIVTGTVTTQLAKGGSGLPFSTNGFEEVILSLDAWAGQVIQVAFQFTSDFSAEAEGWYVDDVRVRGVIPQVELPDLVGKNFSVSNPHARLGEVDINYSVANEGVVPAAAFSTHVIWSPNGIIGDEDDVIIAGSQRNFDGLAVGATLRVDASLSIDRAALFQHSVASDPPGDPVGTVSQDISHLFLVIDPAETVAESDASNNSGQGVGLDSGQMTYFPWDSGGDGVVTPIDALTAIQNVNTATLESDFDGNGIVTPLEALSALQRIGYQRHPNLFATLLGVAVTEAAGLTRLVDEASVQSLNVPSIPPFQFVTPDESIDLFSVGNPIFPDLTTAVALEVEEVRAVDDQFSPNLNESL